MLEAPNIVVGAMEGVDTLVVTYQGLETTLPIVIVYIGSLSSTSINEMSAETWEVNCYPNPAQDYFILP